MAILKEDDSDDDDDDGDDDNNDKVFTLKHKFPSHKMILPHFSVWKGRNK